MKSFLTAVLLAVALSGCATSCKKAEPPRDLCVEWVQKQAQCLAEMGEKVPAEEVASVTAACQAARAADPDVASADAEAIEAMKLDCPAFIRELIKHHSN